MKLTKITLIICTLFIVAFGDINHANAKVKGAKAEFVESYHNFGNIQRKSDALSHAFSFTNSGTEPLVILSATTSCSCIKASFSRKPISAGESGEITITIDPRKVESGIFHRIVQIHSNSIGGTTIITLEGIAE